MKRLYKFSSLTFLGLSLGLWIGVTSSSASTLEQTIYCPDDDAQHDHGFENTTRPSSGYESYFIAHKLRIYLHDDFMDSIDLNTLECSSPEGWISCDGGRTYDDPSDTEDYGGVRTELVQNDTSADAVYPDYIEWTYGVDEATEKPFAPGKNDYDGDGDVDNTADQRSMGESVFFQFTGDDSTASATTTASLYVQFWEYEQSCGDFGSTSCWDEVEEDGSTEKHWNDNDTDTVITNYECDEAPALTCESLSISPDTGDLNISDVFTDIPFTVTATGSDGSDITADSTFTYSINKFGSANDAADANGDIRYGWTSSSKNPITGDNTVTFRDTEPGDSLYVYVSDYDGNSYENECSAEVVLPYCTDLEITDPTGFGGHLGLINSESYTSNINVTTDTSSNEAWPFELTYESENGIGTFDGNSSPYTTLDTSISIYTSTDSDTVNVGIDPAYDVTGTCNDSFDYTLYSTPSAPKCESLEITEPTAPISAVAMANGHVEISWESTITGGLPNPSVYTCTSSNPNGEFEDSTGMIWRTSVTTPFTTVYYTGEAGDRITCESTAPYTSPECSDTITSQRVTEAPVCSDLSLGDPYVENAGTATPINLSNQRSLQTLYADDTVCFDFETTVESGFSGTLRAMGYTDSSRTTLTSGLISLDVTGVSGDIGNPARVGINGATTYTGTLCWENYDENYVLDFEVLSEALCSETVTLPPLNEIPEPPEPPETPGGGGSGSGGSDLDCDDVVDVRDTDEAGICAEYSMNLCVEDDDIEVVSEGDEICYYDENDPTNPIDCEEDRLTIPGENSPECYDVEIEGDVCDNEVSVEYDGDPDACFEDSPEQQEVGVLNKYIYTFNFLDNKVYNSDEDVFFTHDEDRTFYTLEYTPSGAEDTLVFTDDMWDSDGIEGVFGDSQNESTNGHVWLAENLADLTDYEYNYKTIESFGFGDTYEEGSGTYLAPYVQNFTDTNYQTFVPYLKYDDSDSKPSTVVYACAPSNDEDGDTVYGEDGLLCFNPEYTPEDEGKVVIVNADTIPSDATLRIRYVGVIDSGITDECDDSDDECLTEIFENSAQVYADPSNIDAPNSSTDAYDEDSARLVVLCSYLMTQNAGDIYLEGDLDSGSDISCAYINEEQNYSSYSNTDGLVILDAGSGDSSDDTDSSSESSSSSSTDSEPTTYYDSSFSEVSVCDEDSSADNFIGNLSSYVCEIVSAVSDLWKSGTVSSTTDSHVSQAVRNAETDQGSETVQIYSGWNAVETALANNNNPDSGILYFKGNGDGSSITLTGDFNVPCGAWTLIVTDADLRIASDIEYEQSCTNGKSYTTDLPSIAFVVEGGDIVIEDSAFHLVGVYYTDQSITGDERSAVDGALTFDGSIYGNIDPLLDAANYVGSPSLDGGSVVVRYDSRILLNTPPALSEYVDVDTQKGVN